MWTGLLSVTEHWWDQGCWNPSLIHWGDVCPSAKAVPCSYCSFLYRWLSLIHALHMGTGYTARIEEGSKNDSQIFVIHGLKAQKKFLVGG